MRRTTAAKVRGLPSSRPATRKGQVVLSAEQYELLEAYARERGRTVSALLRDNLERTLLPILERRRREAALRRLSGQQLPTADWEAIERELEERWSGHDVA